MIRYHNITEHDYWSTGGCHSKLLSTPPIILQYEEYCNREVTIHVTSYIHPRGVKASNIIDDKMNACIQVVVALVYFALTNTSIGHRCFL